MKYYVPIFKTRLERVGAMETSRITINNTQDAADFILPYLRFRTTEEVVALYLDHNNKLLGSEVVHIGSPTSSQFDIRTILKSALLADCSKLIIVHNHPNGLVTDITEEDLTATALLATGCQSVGIEFYDHIVVNDTGEVMSLGNVIEMLMESEGTKDGEARAIHQGRED